MPSSDRLTLRLALLCEEVTPDSQGISSIRRIIADMSPGGLQVEMTLPATITWAVALWFFGRPGHMFRVTVDARSSLGESLATDACDVVLADYGEGHLWRPIGPLAVSEPGPIHVSVAFNGLEVWKRAGYITQPSDQPSDPAGES